ncbi:MAG: SOS response-associated peptidase [Bacteroidota bacterium]
MCYNIAFLTKRLEKYAERYKDTQPPGFLAAIQDKPDLPQYYFASGFDFPVLPLITGTGINFSSWGLIPNWAKDHENAAQIRTKTHNAVGETVFEKPSFRKSIVSQRCLLGINGFYEWRQFNKSKYPYLVTVKSSEIFSLGCIYDLWTDRNTGELFHTFSVLTTPANPLMETIHNTKKRMPLIISRENEKSWISSGLSIQEVRELIRPYDEADMEAYTISMAVNQVRNNRNVPEIMKPVNYPELTFFGT